MINYNNKRFRTIKNSDNAETSEETVFVYFQNGNIITSVYHGGQIIQGHLIATVDENSCLDMSYHQINTKGQLMTGVCKSTPEILENGKIRLHEKWQWTNGDKSVGESVLEEL